MESIRNKLNNENGAWLITGVGGFIGSNILETLLKLDQKVVGVDNFSTGYKRNLEEVKILVTKDQWENFQFLDGDICNLDFCRSITSDVKFVLHQAALGSVPRSIKDPLNSHENNVNGFLNMLIASRDSNVKKFVFASSSSVYGNNDKLPKIEKNIGDPLSPYALTKLIDELYAEVFFKSYALNSIGLRYFNVFGKRQDPMGSYAAVIPRWIKAMIKNEELVIFGDGETSRDFCYVDNVVQANILSAITKNPDAQNKIFNVSVGEQTSLKQLFSLLKKALAQKSIYYERDIIYKDFREGDVKHSLADITRASALMGYSPSHKIEQGLIETIEWYVKYL